MIGSLIGTPNQVEAVTANFEKRAPVFTDPDEVLHGDAARLPPRDSHPVPSETAV